MDAFEHSRSLCSVILNGIKVMMSVTYIMLHFLFFGKVKLFQVTDFFVANTVLH